MDRSTDEAAIRRLFEALCEAWARGEESHTTSSERARLSAERASGEPGEQRFRRASACAIAQARKRAATARLVDRPWACRADSAAAPAGPRVA
ncbi:hypothetical protein BE04_31205 [Sorangium cellulosum]|uniref:Uncharacterized protein n=1 Tax=Sorangium cellulosum TaxID=56 RepID=A0A150PPH2_SORCE|nr:hypothetical protein [Sorangium cellulosum]KYF57328.1 hypothetical protein BE04_31205 [Sorangium cellulosum]